MAARWVVGAILLVMLAIVGIFVWAVIRPPAPPPEAAAGTPVAAEKRIEGPAGAWLLAAQAVPRAVLRMLEMTMADEPVPLIEDGPGSWRGSARAA